MQVTPGRAIDVLAAMLLVAVILSTPGQLEGIAEAAAASTTSTPKITAVASIPYWDQERAFRSVQKNINQIDVVSVFWYFLARDGRVKAYSDAREDASIVSFAHRHDVKVLALITNLPEEEGESWDWRRVDRVISTLAARKRHVSDIIRLVTKMNFDGINIDYEYLRDAQTSHFSAFIRELSSALHRRGKVLKVAIQPRSTNRYTNGQDWAAIAKAVDQFSIMTYEEHWNESHPGPIASLPWVEKVLRFARGQGIPAKKIFMGVPLYGYDWPRRSDGSYGTAQSVQHRDVRRLLRTYNLRPRFDSNAGGPYFQYSDGKRQHVVWYENTRSFTSKLSLAGRFRIGGITLWRLGAEDEGMWRKLPPRTRK